MLIITPSRGQMLRWMGVRRSIFNFSILFLVGEKTSGSRKFQQHEKNIIPSHLKIHIVSVYYHIMDVNFKHVRYFPKMSKVDNEIMLIAYTF